MSSAVGDRVRALRKLAGLTTRQTDALAGLTSGHTSQVENFLGERVSARTLDGLARVFGVTVEYFLRGGEMPTSDALHVAVTRARTEPNEAA